MVHPAGWYSSLKLKFVLFQVFTVEEMLPQVQDLPGAQCKNLFMKDKKKKGLWLLSARHDVEVNLGALSKKVSAPGGLRFADESILIEKLGVKQGCVTPFALINDKGNDVKFIVDEALIGDKFDFINFHLLTNAATTGISPKDFVKFVEATGHSIIPVNLDES